MRVDFSANASIYDRRHGSILSPAIAGELARCSGLVPGCRILEIGAGTGRVALAFSNLGLKTVALEPSLPMLTELRRKCGENSIHVAAGEGARLPFLRHCFDAVVLARILYLMADWRTVLNQAHEILKPGGYLLHEWGNGQSHEPWVQIREKARTLFQQAGIESPFHPGARSEDEVSAYLVNLGFTQTDELAIGPGPATSLRDFVEKIMSGEVSYIWNVPQHIRETCLPELRNWCEQTFDLNQPSPMPRELCWTIQRKPV